MSGLSIGLQLCQMVSLSARQEFSAELFFMGQGKMHFDGTGYFMNMTAS